MEMKSSDDDSMDDLNLPSTSMDYQTDIVQMLNYQSDSRHSYIRPSYSHAFMSRRGRPHSYRSQTDRYRPVNSRPFSYQRGCSRSVFSRAGSSRCHSHKTNLSSLRQINAAHISPGESTRSDVFPPEIFPPQVSRNRSFQNKPRMASSSRSCQEKLNESIKELRKDLRCCNNLEKSRSNRTSLMRKYNNTRNPLILKKLPKCNRPCCIKKMYRSSNTIDEDEEMASETISLSTPFSMSSSSNSSRQDGPEVNHLASLLQKL